MTVDFDSRPAHERYLQAAARVLTRTDRILTSRTNLAVTTPEFGPAPAWTDGVDISIRATDWATSFQDAGARARLLGLNYHELAHILHTPREGSPAYKAIAKANLTSPYNLYKVLNAADDQRIETLFTAIYAPAAAFFTQAVLDLIITDSPQVEMTWALVAGRRYLPTEVRRISKAAYAGDADAYQALMDQYVQIDWEFDIPRGVALLEQIAAHLAALAIESEGCGASPTRGDIDGEQGDEARERAQDQAKEQDQAEQAEAQDEPEGDEGDDEQGESEDSGQTTDQAEDADADQAEDETAEADTDEDGTEQDGASDGTEARDQDDDQGDWDEALEQAAKDAERETQQQAEALDRQVDIEMAKGEGQIGDTLPRWDQRVPVTDAARSLADGLADTLAELRSAIDPGWVTHQAQGHIDVARYQKVRPWETYDEAFNRFVPGAEDALDIEIAIMVDTSSSMTAEAALQVAEGAWALKRALGHHEISVAVMTFDSDTMLVYGADDEADDAWMPKPRSHGSTVVGPGLIEIGQHFNYSSHRRRVLVVLTDGGFTEYSRVGETKWETELVIAAINAEVRLGLGFGPGTKLGKAGTDLMGFTETRHIDQIDQMVQAIRETIVEGVLQTGVLDESWI